MRVPRVVLVVDDDASTLSLIAAFLRHQGFLVRTASNGREALAQAATRRPDVILLDLDMPVMDGREFLRARAADAMLRTVPVIVFSATLEPDDLGGADAILHKPTELDDLLGAITMYARALEVDDEASNS